MKLFSFLFTTVLLTNMALSEARSEVTVMDTPMAATTLYLTERQVSTYYTVEGDLYSVVVVFPTGSGDNLKPVKQSIQLADGQSFNLSIGGYGNDKSNATLKMTRINDRIMAEVL